MDAEPPSTAPLATAGGIGMHDSPVAPDRSLAGHKVLVTGASRGIGHAIALALASHGAAVAINYSTSQTDAEAVAAQARSRRAEAVTCQGDVSSRDGATRAVETAREKLRGLTGLVCNAAGDTSKIDSALPRRGTTFLDSDTSVDSLRRTVLTQYDCVVETCRAAIPHLRDTTNGATILLVGASVTRGALPQPPQIYAAKSLQDALARLLSSELASRNIRVHTLAPGFVPTDANSGPRQQLVMNHLNAGAPMGEMPSINAIADAATLLFEPRSAPLTSLYVPVDAGYTQC